MSAPDRQWLPAPVFLEMHRDPVTRRRLISKEALYHGVRTNTIPHVHSGRRILVPSDLFDQLAARPGDDAETRPDAA